MSNCKVIQRIGEIIDNPILAKDFIAPMYSNFSNTDIPFSMTKKGTKSKLFNSLLVRLGNVEDVVKVMSKLEYEMHKDKNLKNSIIPKGAIEPDYKLVRKLLFGETLKINSKAITANIDSSTYTFEGMSTASVFDSVESASISIKKEMYISENKVFFDSAFDSFVSKLNKAANGIETDIVSLQAELKEFEDDKEALEDIQEDIDLLTSQLNNMKALSKGKNISKLKRLTKEKLRADSFIKISKDTTEDVNKDYNEDAPVEEFDEVIQSSWGERLDVDYNNTAIQGLKMTMSGINKVNELGISLVNSLGVNETFDMGYIFDYIYKALDNSSLTVQEMLDVLEKKGEIGKVIVEHLSRAEDTQRVRNNFKTVFTTQKSNMKTVLVNSFNEAKFSKVIDTNRNNLDTVLSSLWMSNQVSMQETIGESDKAKDGLHIITRKGFNLPLISKLAKNELKQWKKLAGNSKNLKTNKEVILDTIINGGISEKGVKFKGLLEVVNSFGFDMITEDMLYSLLSEPNRYAEIKFDEEGNKKEISLLDMFIASKDFGAFHYMLNSGVVEIKSDDNIHESLKSIYSDINPLNQKSFKSLTTKLYSTFSDVGISSTYHNAAGKQVNDNGLPNDLSLAMDKLKHKNKEWVHEMRMDSFGRRSNFLPSITEQEKQRIRNEFGLDVKTIIPTNNYSVYSSLEIGTLDAKSNTDTKGKGKSRTRSVMSNGEQALLAIDLLYNGGNKKGAILPLVMSDKTRLPLGTYNKLTFNEINNVISVDAKGKVAINVINDRFIMNRLIEPVWSEIDRFNHYKRMENKYNLLVEKPNEELSKSDKEYIKDYEKLNKDVLEGATKLYFYNKLNGKFLTVDEKGNKVEKYILERRSDGTIDNNDVNIARIKKAINTSLKNSIEATTKVLTKDVISNLPLALINRIKMRLFETAELDNDMLKKYNSLLPYVLASELDLNSIYTNHNFMMTFGGDMAMYYKRNRGNSWYKDAKDNYFKRMGGLIGTATRGNYIFENEDGTIDDYSKVEIFVIDDPATNRYKEVLKDFSEADYGNVNPSDAQEFTSLREHFSTLYFRGAISTKDFKRLMTKVDKGTINEEDYNIGETGSGMLPAKPLTRGLVYDSFTRSRQAVYLKSSSFGLNKQMTDGMSIDILRKAIEKREAEYRKDGENVNVRVIFKSGAKQFPYKAVDVFNIGKGISPEDKGAMFDEAKVEAMFTEGGLIIDRDITGVQQEESHNSDMVVVTISQLNKLAFQGLLTGKAAKYEFKVPGIEKAMTSIELKRYKEDIRKRIFKERQSEIESKYDIDTTTGKFKSYDKIIGLIKDEIASKGGINEADMLKINKHTGDLEVPLYLTPVFNKVVANLTSLITNNILKSKMKGASYVQGSSVGIMKLSEFKGSAIIFTEGFDKALKFTSPTEDGIQRAQVIIPWDFYNKDDSPLDINDYIKDNKINYTKLPKELLEMISARIPNQSHSSTMAVDIVGFLPKGVNDLILLPDEVTRQTGSDFDIDHLYNYMYNFDIAKDGTLSKAVEGIEGMQNEYLSVLNAIFVHPEVAKRATNPLDMPDVSDYVDGDIKNAFSEDSLINQLGFVGLMSEYNSNQGGKKGIAVQSNNSVFLAQIEDKGLELAEGTDISVTINGESLTLTKLGLGKYKSKSGVWRTNFDFNSMAQSEAVDNANNKLLDKMGWTAEVSSMYNAMIDMTTKDNKAVQGEFIISLFNQPVVKEFINRVKNSEGQLTFGNDSSSIILSELLEEYNSDVTDDLTLKELEDVLNVNITTDENIQKMIKDGKTKEEIDEVINGNKLNIDAIYQTQTKVIALLNKIYPIGEAIKEMSSIVGVDSKGIGKDFNEVASKIDTYYSILNNPVIDNTTNLFNNSDGTKTELGEAIESGLKYSMKLFSTPIEGKNRLVPIASPAMTDLYEKFMEVTGQDTMSTYNRKIVTDGFMKFLKSSNELPIMEGTDVSLVLHGLISGKNKLSNKILNYIRQEGVIEKPEYYFLSKLIPNIDKNTGNTTIQYKKVGATTETTELMNINSFASLFQSTDPNAVELGIDLLKYNYVTGDSLGFNSFNHLIMPTILKLTGTQQYLKDTANDLESKHLSNLALIQILQHNSNLISPTIHKVVVSEDVDTATIKVLKNNVSPPFIIKPNKKLNMIGVLETISNSSDDKHTEFIYKLLPFLGKKGVVEYNKNKVINYSVLNRKGKVSSVEQLQIANSIITNDLSRVNNKILNKFKDPSNITKEEMIKAINQETGLGKFIAKMQHYMPYNTKLEFDLNITDKGLTNVGTSVVKINPNNFDAKQLSGKQHIAEFEDNLAHELLHIVLHNVYKNSNNVLVNKNKAMLDNMRKYIIKKLWLEDEVNTYVANKAKQSVLVSKNNQVNFLHDVDEFIIGLKTDRAFYRSLKEIPMNEDLNMPTDVTTLSYIDKKLNNMFNAIAKEEGLTNNDKKIIEKAEDTFTVEGTKEVEIEKKINKVPEKDISTSENLINKISKEAKVEQKSTVTDNNTKIDTITNTYSGNITKLGVNQIFVFGSNPLGINGDPIKYPNMSASVATANNWVKQGEKMNNIVSHNGKAYGLVTVTKPGGKKSLTKQQIISNISKLYKLANSNRDKQYLIAYKDTGTRRNNNGYTAKEMAVMFGNFVIPSNIVFESSFKLLIPKNTQQKFEFKDEISKGAKVEQVTEVPYPKSFKGKMSYSYNGNQRSDITSKTTFEAIQKGERTATTRFEGQGNIEYWKGAKLGDIITWSNGKGSVVEVKVTKPLHKLVGSGKNVEAWSKLEGWSVDYFKSNVKPKLSTAYQLEFELVNKVLNDVSTEVKSTGEDTVSDVTTIKYIPKGKQEQSYTVSKEGEIKNKKGDVVFKENSIDRNRILFENELTKGKAEVVSYKDANYIVTEDRRILSKQTNKVMKWGEENGNRIAILDKSTYKSKEVVKTPIDIFEEEVEEIGDTKEEISKTPADLQFKFPDGITIETPFKLTDGQKEGLIKMYEFVNYESKNEFMLEGVAGTGKTTVIRFFIQYLGEKGASLSRIKFSTPSHKSMKKLFMSIKDTTIKGRKPFNSEASYKNSFLTVQAAIGATKITTNEGREFKYRGMNKKLIGTDLWIIDESSMIGEGKEAMYSKIKSILKEGNIDVIYMGDFSQLLPVGSASPLENMNNKHELLEVKRQDKMNPLMHTLDKFRTNQESKEDRLTYKTEINSKGDGIRYMKSNGDFISKAAEIFKSDAYKKDADETKLLTYRNETVFKYNQEIRKRLWGKFAPRYVKGDVLMGYMQASDTVIKNSQEYIVQDAKFNQKVDVVSMLHKGKKAEVQEYLNEKGIGDISLTADTLRVKENNPLFDDPTYTIYILNPADPMHKDSYVNYYKLLTSIRNDIRGAWRTIMNKKTSPEARGAAHEERSRLDGMMESLSVVQISDNVMIYKDKIYSEEEFKSKVKEQNPNITQTQLATAVKKYKQTDKSIDYGYAMTANKAQGSDYKHPFADMEDVYGRNNYFLKSDPLTTNRRGYVILSRTTKDVTVYHPNTISEENTFDEDKAKRILELENEFKDDINDMEINRKNCKN